MKKPLNNKIITGFLAIALCSFLGSCGKSSVDQPTSIEEAKAFVVDTWTYTGTKYFGGSSIKWDIKSDGTLLEYIAHRYPDHWGEPKKGTWEIEESRYADTGEWYYAFRRAGIEQLSILLDT